MPKLLYTWYFEEFTASVTSSGHSALRHEVSRMCTILFMGVVGNVCSKKIGKKMDFGTFLVYISIFAYL